MNKSNKFLTPGENVWVVERDECDNAVEVTGYMFLAVVSNAVIAASFIGFNSDLEENLEYLIEDTVESQGATLFVFPMKDCYQSRKEAEHAIKWDSVNVDD